MHSLRTRFTAFLLLVALVPIAVLYYYNLHSNDEIKNELATEILGTAFLVNSEINQFLADRVKLLEVTAGSLAIKEGKFSNFQQLPVPEFVDSIERLSDVFDSFSLLLQINRHGRLLAAAATTDEGEQIDVSTLYKKDWSTVGWFVDSIAEADATLNNISAPLILKPLKTTLVPGINRHTEYVLPVVVPIRNHSNELLGTMVAFISVDAFKHFLKQGAEALGKINIRHSHLHLASSDGFVYADYSNINYANDSGNRIRYSHKAVLAGIRNNLAEYDERAGRGISQWMFYEPGNEKGVQLVVYDRRSSAEDIYGLGWVVVIHLPSGEVFESVRNAARNFTTATLAVIVLVIVFGSWAGTTLTKPITSIIEAMSRLRKGSTMEKVEGMRRRDEVGKLANAFISFQYFINNQNRALRKQANQFQELVHARKEVETLMVNSNEPLFVVNARGIIDRINPAAEMAFGYDKGELVGKSVAVLVPARFKGHDEMLHAYMENPEYRSMSAKPNLQGRKKDGSKIFVDISLSPLETVEGMKALVNVRDLTQERRAQEETRKLALVVEKTNNLVVMTDKEHKIVWVNNSFERVTGYTRKEVIGKKVGSMLRGKDTNAETVATLDRALHDGHAVRVEILNYTKDRRPIWLDIDIHPVYGEEGIEHFVAIETDVTVRHLMEDQLRKGKDELEGQVAERTKELSLALEKADVAARAKSAFLATMSHEIRTPINGVVGMVELLRNTAMQPRQIEMLDVVKDSSLSLQRIIDDILDYSKIESGKLNLEQVPVSLKKLVASVCEILGPAATSRSVNLVTHMDDKLPETILADPVRLRQVLYNLVGNAIKFTEPSGIIHVDIVASDISDELAAIEMIVRDTGIGMSMDDIDHLFKPFSQADESTTRRYGGTGLGLSICKRLVEMMGGQIEVESSSGEGSIFRVKLEFPVEDATTEEAPDLTGVRVLGVSAPEMQESELSYVLKDYISRAGVTVDCLSEKDEVIVQTVSDSARTGNPYDVVLICQQATTGYHYSTYEALHAMPEAERPGMLMLIPQSDHNSYAGIATVIGNPLNINKLLGCLAVVAGRTVSDKVKCCVVAEEESEPGRVTGSLSQTEDETAEKKEDLILLVEDNLVNQEVLNMQLSALGYTAMTAADGREALELWNQHAFDLVLTDCNMPEMDGFELARAIRKAEIATGTHIPIIAVTANAMSEELQNCFDSGMDDCLTKPIEIDNLGRAIDKWLAVPVQDNKVCE